MWACERALYDAALFHLLTTNHVMAQSLFCGWFSRAEGHLHIEQARFPPFFPFLDVSFVCVDGEPKIGTINLVGFES